jgi:ribosome modulation factor
VLASTGLVKTDPNPSACLDVFADGRAAAWAGAIVAGCPYRDGSPAIAWRAGWRAGRAEMRCQEIGRHVW